MYINKINTIEFYSTEYWSKIFGINLKSEIKKTKNKIQTLPKGEEFLKKIKNKKINIILVTNCPRGMLNIKLKQTNLWDYFNEIISSEDYGFPKEHKEF